MKRICLAMMAVLIFAVQLAVAQSPGVTFGNLKNGQLVSKNQITGNLNPSLVAACGNCTVSDYIVTVAVGDKYEGPFVNKGPRLNIEVVNAINKTPGPNVRVYFDEIRVKINGSEAHATPMMLKYDQ